MFTFVGSDGVRVERVIYIEFDVVGWSFMFVGEFFVVIFD